MFEWDEHNLRKIQAHREEVEQALINDPILIYERAAGEEIRLVYYGDTDACRLIAAVITDRRQKIRVVTAYDLDAGQKRDYSTRRLQDNQ
jgi:uncharacterized DUF497 family protein